MPGNLFCHGDMVYHPAVKFPDDDGWKTDGQEQGGQPSRKSSNQCYDKYCSIHDDLLSIF